VVQQFFVAIAPLVQSSFHGITVTEGTEGNQWGRRLNINVREDFHVMEERRFFSSIRLFGDIVQAYLLYFYVGCPACHSTKIHLTHIESCQNEPAMHEFFSRHSISR